MFLTREQLYELTGYKLPSKQIRELRRLGVRHYVNALGRPVVPESAVDSERGTNDAVRPDLEGLAAR